MIDTTRDRLLIWFGLLFGLLGLVIHSWLIIDAAQHTGQVFPKYVTEVDYNAIGEGDVELFFIPGITLVTGYASYRYFVDELLV